ncbi:hypothetical protein FOZ61_008928 [Perkinsus olseni]|uniref:Isovaleryl-CoA dehydrogenase n=1 Tax=Perkinsus olseni TaxID=32597 RepID=A0A7J6L245_PEROL|nr:hypothetical protein FOZ61_008928 [Perkinsus olseni]
MAARSTAARVSSGLLHRLLTPTAEHAALREMMRAFVAKEVEPQALHYDRLEKCNLSLLKKLGDLGLHGICVDEEYGGSGMDAVAAVIAHEELSYSDPGFCLSYLAHSMLFVNNLFHNGSEQQKRRLLPSVISGELIGSMGMSEPGCGTDVLAMTTKATPDGDGWRLDGAKMWITNGCLDTEEEGVQLGDCCLVYAKAPEGLSLFLVEKPMEGFRVGQKIRDKCGMRASSTAELIFDDVKIPRENLVGELGKGVVPMMRNLEIERVTLAAMSLGIARRCLDVMLKYTQERKSFDKPLADFGQIQRHFAESYAQWAAARAYVYSVAAQLKLDSASGSRTDSDGVKLFATTMAKDVADRAMQCLGGYGYVGEYAVERLWRDAKLLEIGGGTLEAHQKNITRDLGKAGACLGDYDPVFEG